MTTPTFDPRLFTPTDGNIHINDIPQGLKHVQLSDYTRPEGVIDPILNTINKGSYLLSKNENATSSDNSYVLGNLHSKTLLTSMFFSDRNINNIQDLLKIIIYREMDAVIDTQSVPELLTVMRSLFLRFNQHPPDIQHSMTPKQVAEISELYTREVVRLNELLIKTILPGIISQLQGYLDYIRDLDRGIYVMENPQQVSSAGTKNNREITRVLSGVTII